MRQCPICSQSFADDQAVCPNDGVRLIELHDWAPQTTVRGKYRILGKLGAGGMGIVYKAQHLILEELRALKVMSPELARDQKFVRRFRQEAQVTRRLRHPNIVQVDDLDQADDGSLFIAMELVDGVSVRQLLERTRGPLPLARALAIARGVAEALGTAHGQGLVHRDIKPDNILLARDGTGRDIPKVMDFGIVAMKESSAQLSSHPLLTPAYAPPEQWGGMKGSELDGRADLYALGMTLYEMLTGKTAFRAETPQGWMQAHMNEEPAPPSRVNPELPQEVDRLVMRLLAKDREQRTPSAEELIQELNLVEAQSAWGLKTVVPAGQLPTVLAPATRIPAAKAAPAPAPARPPASPQAVKPVLPRPRMAEETGGQPKPRRWGIPIAVGALVVAGLSAWFVMRPKPAVLAPARPTISYFAATPTRVEKGGAVTIAWAVKDAYAVRIEPAPATPGAASADANGGTLPLQGERSVIIRGTTLYRLIATGGGGTAERALTVESIEKSPLASGSPQRQPSQRAMDRARQIGVEPTLTYVTDESNYRRLMGIRSLGSQGTDRATGADAPGGGAAVEDRDGTLFLQGTERKSGGARTAFQAMVTRVDESSFEADGSVEMVSPLLNGGRPCVFRGKMTFRMAEDGRWRVHLPASPCGEGGDFLALSLEPPTSGTGTTAGTTASSRTEPTTEPPKTEPARSEPSRSEPAGSETPSNNPPATDVTSTDHRALPPPEPGKAVRFQGTYGDGTCELALIASNKVGFFRSGTLKIMPSLGAPQVVALKVPPSNDATFVTLQDQRGCRLEARASLDASGWPNRLYEGGVKGMCPSTKWEVKRVE
jgi:serine/threonine-protein kinase